MSLAEDKELMEIHETDFTDARAAMETWQHSPPSTISQHDAACCHIAREWFLAMDYSQLNAVNPLTGPRWLRQKYGWGPSSWPIFWCELAEQKKLDCGALAALAHEIFIARGVSSYPVQLIQQYNEDASRQWYKGWGGDETAVKWIKEDLIYHEGCAVAFGGDEIKIWDPTATWWVNEKQFGGYGVVLALRLFAPPPATAPAAFRWGKHRIVPNQWQKIERARRDFNTLSERAAG
jgi:hypothetical protein